MNWQRWTKSLGRKAHKPSRPVSFRPALDQLGSRIVPAQLRVRPGFSTITLDPSLNVGAGDMPLTEQAPGSLTTGYVGRQNIDIDLNALTLQFNATGSQILGRDSGSWQPDVNGVPGSSPAEYGAEFDFLGENFVALRDITINISSGLLTLTPNGPGQYTFPATGFTYNQTGGNLDYQTGFFGNGRTDFTGSSASSSTSLGTVVDQGTGTLTIIVPVEGSIFVDLGSGASTTVDFVGTVGGILPPVPAPPSGPGHTDVDPLSARSAAEGSSTVLGTPLSGENSLRPSQATPAQETTTKTNVVDLGTPRTIVKVANHVVDSVFVDRFKVF